MSTSNSGLTAATTPLTGTEVMYVVQGGNSRKATTGNLYIPGGTDVAVADGGTGGSTAAAARTNLGLVIGTDVQAYSANLASWAAVTRVANFDAFVAAGTSASLKSLITDETGSGALVFGTSPTITTPTIAGTNGSQAPLSAGLNDSSSVAGNAAKFWNPLYFGNAGTAIVHRLNRVFIGEAAASSSDIGPVVTKDWMETLLGSTTSVSQLVSVSATGQLAMTGGARSSDYRTIFASATGGAQGITGIGYNDDTTAATTPIAAGIVGIAIRAASVVGITLNQMDVNNGGAVVDATPFGGVNSGSTWAMGLTSGAYAGLVANHATGAMYIGAGGGGKVFRKGIVSMNGALDTTLGQGGGGITYESYRGQSFRWLNSGSTVDAEFWGDSAGLKVATVGGVQLNVANVASAVNYLKNAGAATTASPTISVDGSDTNVSMAFATKGTGLYDFFTASTVRQFRVYDTPSAVNYIQLSGSATGAATTFATVGADATVSMVITAKSTGSIFINSGASRSAEFQSPASAVNNMLINGAVTTAGPLMITSGSDTNITGILRGKGTGGFDLQDGGSASKFKYNTTGIGFFNATPVARGAQAALTGTIQRGTFDTATVTLPQLAGVVMAIVNDWRAYGLAS